MIILNRVAWRTANWAIIVVDFRLDMSTSTTPRDWPKYVKDAPTQLETVAVNGASLRCITTRVADRYRLAVEIVTTGEAVAALSSVDAAVDQPWPLTPPWQELHVHAAADGRVLMLVGRAGKSHWSMSVTAEYDRPALIFDVACRLREPPDFLGTTYQLSRTDFLFRPNSEGEVRTELEIQPTAAGSPSLLLKVDEIAGAASATIDITDDQLIIRAPQPTQPHATVRWKYRLVVCD